jgi:hypothetical protein
MWCGSPGLCFAFRPPALQTRRCNRRKIRRELYGNQHHKCTNDARAHQGCESFAGPRRPRHKHQRRAHHKHRHNPRVRRHGVLQAPPNRHHVVLQLLDYGRLKAGALEHFLGASSHKPPHAQQHKRLKHNEQGVPHSLRHAGRGQLGVGLLLLGLLVLAALGFAYHGRDLVVAGQRGGVFRVGFILLRVAHFTSQLVCRYIEPRAPTRYH